VNEQQVAGMIWQLQQKVDDLENKLRRLERIVQNIDSNTAATANMVRDLKRK
jgi:ABC-type transporter Mla subunit MlaD